MYDLLLIKNKIENAFLFPFILIGRLISRLKPLKKEYNVFFLFPFYHTGGVEKVHYNLIQAMGSGKCIIFFTRKSYNDNYLNEFMKSDCTIREISKYTDNKFLYFLNFIFRGIISGYINNQRNPPIVFNGQSNLGYKISPWISKKISQIELIHAFNTFSFIRVPFIKNYIQSLTISKKVITDHFKLYDRYKIPEHFKISFDYIENRIELPVLDFSKSYSTSNLKVLYVGRGTEEKRVHLVARIAKIIKEKNLQIDFLFAGDVKGSVPPDLHMYCDFLGDLSQEDLHKVYLETHILIITSVTESGPLVFMEAMARGSCIITTPVGYTPQHIHDHKTGFLLNELFNGDKIIVESVRWIEYLNVNRGELSEIGKYNIDYAARHFGLQSFNTAYKELFSKYGYKP